MPSSIIAKYSPEIIFGENTPVAITDSRLKIIWFSKSFKEYFAGNRLKGKTLTSLLNSAGIEKEVEEVYKKPAILLLPEINKELHITPLFAQKNKKDRPDNYKLELIDLSIESQPKAINDKLSKDDLNFRNVLQDILTLLVKENSIDKLSSEILLKSVSLTKSNIGIITFLIENSETEFKYLDPQNIVSNKSEVEKTVKSDFKFISKWLMINKSSLVAANQKNNLGQKSCFFNRMR